MPQAQKPTATPDQINAEMLAEMKRLRAANEKLVKRGSFSIVRVLIVLFLLGLICFFALPMLARH